MLGTLDPNRGLQMRPGGWTVDLSGTVARFAVASALIAGVMWHEGLDQLPGFLFPQVLPLLFDVRRARLTKQDERLLLQLRMHTTTEQLAYPWPAEALYARLPDDLRGKVSPVDFEDFVTRLVQVGEADDAGPRRGADPSGRTRPLAAHLDPALTGSRLARWMPWRLSPACTRRRAETFCEMRRSFPLHLRP
ncbi:hypothetical protein GCM10020218_099460 [Dactylosporangium vinaceum]